MSKNKPVHEIRLGRVRAAVWQDETSTSFGRDDLPLLEKLAAAAHVWLYEGTAEPRPAEEDDGLVS